ncbi:MAG: glutathione S-transferase family protein [Alphaproteobacteria bacterium]
MTNTARLELFTARVCPYAHRTRLTLLEKGLEAELVEIDFKNKPARFLAVSPYGRVPALVHGETIVYESAIINEYLDEVFPTPRLMPADPALRARVRIWIDYCDHQFLDDYYALLKERDGTRIALLRDKVEAHLRFIEKEGLGRRDGPGPYWLGESVSLLDLAYYPFFERLPAWRHYRGVTIPEDCAQFRAWLAAMAARPSVRSMATDDAYYVRHYAGYAGVDAAA